MRNTLRSSLILASLLATCSVLSAQDLNFAGNDFTSWSYPRGLVNVQEEGIVVKRFGKAFNAVANASEFRSSIIGDYGQRFARTPSNATTAALAGDQDLTTWWQPNGEDPVEKWWIEIDLGRAVVAEKVRVIFPDNEDGRPFSFFSVYVSPGIPVFGGTAKRIVYSRLGRPINNNTSSVVEFDLKTTGLLPVTGEYLSDSEEVDFDIVRFIRFEAAGKTPSAALAEIEVDGVGFNLSTRVQTDTRVEDNLPHWGGRTWTSKDRDCNGCGKGSGSEALIDQDVGFRGWNIEASDKGNWRDSGVWSVIDFGNVFRVDRIVWMPIVSGQGPFLYGFQRDKQGTWGRFEFLSSDGTPSNSSDPVVEGPYLYELLSSVDNSKRRYLFDFQFDPRPLRLLMWRVLRPDQFHRAVQLFVFHGEGYPAQIELESDDIFLGGARSIRFVEWDADLPSGTRIEVETQTGNGFDTILRYFLANGKEVTKDAYDAAKSRNRGDIVEERVRDDTWSSWSQPQRFSGQEFLSPSPRQWLRARVRLISDDPAVFPTLRSLRFSANSPVITAGLVGRIAPREAPIDSLQTFSYTIRPVAFGRSDAGFDRVLIDLPTGSVDAEFVEARVGGSPVEASAILRSDSLIVQLPPPVIRSDSVEVVFRTRVTESPTEFNTEVVNSQQEENVQGVVPAEYGAIQVFVPDAVAGTSLIRNIKDGAWITPNGDGTNDFYQLSFTVVKTLVDPRVDVFTLSGEHVARLTDQSPDGNRSHYEWNGAQSGTVVPPGVYVVRIEVDADALDERVHRLVRVAY